MVAACPPGATVRAGVRADPLGDMTEGYVVAAARGRRGAGEQPEVRVASTQGGAPLGRGVRVLVVDDTDHVRRVVGEMLQLDGFDVVGQAAGGEEAVRLAVELDPHVIVMDLRMPGIDGLAATRRIREARPTQQVVLYTAYLDATVERAAAEAGVALCLGKVEGLPRLEQELSRLTLAAVRR
jgi:CheY-like chemotaxis protein